MAVVLHEDAERDATGARDWHAERSAIAAPAFLTELSATIAKIAERSAAVPQYLAGTRRRSLINFPFSLVCPVSAENLLVLAVAHHRRKPGYWRQRH